MKETFYFIGANPTCDLIIMNPEGKFLLAKRSDKVLTCPSMWALTGGFVNTLAKKGERWLAGLETPEQAAKREGGEETNLILPDDHPIYPVGVYEGNNRDPRDNEVSWAKSHAYFTMIDVNTYLSQKDNIVGMDDVEEAKWFTLEEIEQMELAFDHKKIFKDALNMYNEQIKKFLEENKHILEEHMKQKTMEASNKTEKIKF